MKISKVKKVICIGILSVMGCSIFSNVEVYAENEKKKILKEEVVYINLDSKGEKEDLRVVNIFNGKSIEDYGNYTDVKNMNTSDEIKFETGKINIESSKDILYYEGILENVEIPWKIEIKYKLDGSEMKPEEMMGKSGKAEIEILVKENENGNKEFFENYSIQLDFKLDTNKFMNIKGVGLTEANVGGMKQFTAIILPGKEAEINVKSDVVNFEMEGINFNGIRLNLNIDKNSIDTSEISKKLDELQEGIKILDEGANELNNGAEGLNKGAKKLEEGSKIINNALNNLGSKSEELKKASEEIKNGLQIVEEGVNSFNKIEEINKVIQLIKEKIENLKENSDHINKKIDEFYNKLNNSGIENMESLIRKNEEVLKRIQLTSIQIELCNIYNLRGLEEAKAKVIELKNNGNLEAKNIYEKYIENENNIFKEYIENLNALKLAEDILKKDINYINESQGFMKGLDEKNKNMITEIESLKEYLKKFSEEVKKIIEEAKNLIQNINRLNKGISLLAQNYKDFDKGINEYTNGVNSIALGYNEIIIGTTELVDGIRKLYDGTTNMAEGTGTLKDEMKGMSGEVDKEIEQMLKEFTKSDYKVESFTSEKNENVKSVQFVMKTPNLNKVEEKKEQEEKKESTLWEKVIRLFKKN